MPRRGRQVLRLCRRRRLSRLATPAVRFKIGLNVVMPGLVPGMTSSSPASTLLDEVKGVGDFECAFGMAACVLAVGVADEVALLIADGGDDVIGFVVGLFAAFDLKPFTALERHDCVAIVVVGACRQFGPILKSLAAQIENRHP